LISSIPVEKRHHQYYDVIDDGVSCFSSNKGKLP